MTKNTNFYPKDFMDRIEKAKENIYSFSEIETLTKKERFLAQQFTYGDINEQKFEKELSKIQSKTPSLIANSLTELEMIFKYVGIDKKTIDVNLHEFQLEVQQSDNKGYMSRFAVWFYQSLTGSYVMYCGHQILIKGKKIKGRYKRKIN